MPQPQPQQPQMSHPQQPPQQPWTVTLTAPSAADAATLHRLAASLHPGHELLLTGLQRGLPTADAASADELRGVLSGRVWSPAAAEGGGAAAVYNLSVCRAALHSTQLREVRPISSAAGFGSLVCSAAAMGWEPERGKIVFSLGEGGGTAGGAASGDDAVCMRMCIYTVMLHLVAERTQFCRAPAPTPSRPPSTRATRTPPPRRSAAPRAAVWSAAPHGTRSGCRRPRRRRPQRQRGSTPYRSARLEAHRHWRRRLWAGPAAGR